MTEAGEVFGNLGMAWVLLIVISAALYKLSDVRPRYSGIANWIGVIAILWMAPMVMIPIIFYT